MFTGHSAFPLTPLSEDSIDGSAFARLIERLADARVDSITALGSTGSYAYLTREQRARVASLAVTHAGNTPVFVGIGALRTRQVLELAEDGQSAGASAVLLPPVSYQTLTADDVFGLYEDVTRNLSVPLIVYDNPGTTHFTFTDDLYAAITRLPHVASVKIPGVPTDPTAAAARVQQLRGIVPADVTIGISGDSLGAAGLNAGCEVWYSVVGGTLPEPIQAITNAARSGDSATAMELSDQLQPLWDLFARHGSLRVTAAIAEQLGLASRSCLPLPIRGLDDADRAVVAQTLERLGITA